MCCKLLQTLTLIDFLNWDIKQKSSETSRLYYFRPMYVVAKFMIYVSFVMTYFIGMSDNRPFFKWRCICLFMV